MAAIHDLIAQVADLRLRERLAAEWGRATRERKFGLVFEDHLPELLPLPKARPRQGDLVAPRGGPLKDLWRVRGAKNGRLQCVRPQAAGASGASGATDAAASEMALHTAEVVVVREFGQPVFPALVPVDAVQNDNVAKARALARFAERHGAHFGRIQLIRKRRVAGGAEQFVRLEINTQAAIQQLLLIVTAAQLNNLFDGAR
jgi:hypothetical protein